MVTCALPPEVLDALPATAEREQDWQNALVLALPHLVPVFLYRQNAGAVVAARGGVVKGAPAGAADLAGWTRGGRPVPVQIECKMRGGKLDARQYAWATTCGMDGLVYLCARYDDRQDLRANILRIAREIAALILLRAGGVDA